MACWILSGTTQVSRYQRGKIKNQSRFPGARGSEWQWDRPDLDPRIPAGSNDYGSSWIHQIHQNSEYKLPIFTYNILM